MTKANYKRIFIKCDLQYKNSHTFSEGTTISLKREFDNFDRKYTQPINAIVIDSAIIPKDAEVLIHHNATHPTYEILDYKGLDEEYISGTERYFSIPESECYAWRIDNEEWNPTPGFEFGLRIFKPYTGFIKGVPPTLIKNKLFITSGQLCGKVVLTKAASDYELIYQNNNGKEARLIRLRHFEEPENIREEILGIDYETTRKINNEEYIIGLSAQNAKPINILV